MNSPKQSTKGPTDPAKAKSSGRVGFDDRGNSVWEWQLQTGVYSRDVNTQRLKKLDLDHLSIADTGVHPRPGQIGHPGHTGKPTASKSSSGSAGGGFNPYDNAVKVGGEGFNPYDSSKALGKKMQHDDSERRAKTPDELRQLDAYLQAQRKAKQSTK